jgi:hypothetical protein
MAVFFWIQLPRPELRSEVLLYSTSNSSKHLFLFVLKFATHMECFDLSHYLIEVVFSSVGVVPRLGLLVNIL